MRTDPLIHWQKAALRKSQFAFLRALRKHPGAGVYVVGGFVRDLLLRRESTDVDVVVSGVPKTVLVKLLKEHGRVSFVGKVFGVYKFVPRGMHGSDAIDIALPRVDLPKGRTGAYRDIDVVSRPDLPIQEDLRRRDFTVNALAWDVVHASLVDVGTGLADLRAKKLRTVGRAEERFQEDFSRMLRGLRFACQLGFTFDRQTWSALAANIHHLNDRRRGEDVVPRESIAKELLKTFWLDPVNAFDLYDRSGAFGVLMPELLAMKKCPQPKPYHMEGSVWAHTKLALERLSSPAFQRRFPGKPDAELVLATLFHDIGKPPTLKTPRKDGVDRIRFDGHDVVGGRLAHAIATRLKLSSQDADSPLHVNPDHLHWLISLHLLLLHDRAREMKLSTIERYFITHPLGTKLQQLILADSLATLPPSGRPYLAHLTSLWTVLSSIQRHGAKPPVALLSGHEVMELVHLESGPDVGLLLRRLREAQLQRLVKTKRQARQFILRDYAERRRS